MSAPIAAFFDLDMTLISKSSAFAFGKPFLKEGLITWRQVLWLMKEQFLFLIRGADDAAIQRQRHNIADVIRGWEAEKTQEVIERAIPDVILPYVFPEGEELLYKHREAGHDVIILSTSGDPMVLPIARELGVDTARGAKVEVKNGICTGEMELGRGGEVKVEHAKELADERGYNLDEAYFYTDSITDLPLMEIVGHPVAVNPDRKLRRAAKERGWKILQFEKSRR
ncbi:MAG: HAD-IB family hydrolase [Lawsonella sp.]